MLTGNMSHITCHKVMGGATHMTTVTVELPNIFVFYFVVCLFVVFADALVCSFVVIFVVLVLLLLDNTL